MERMDIIGCPESVSGYRGVRAVSPARLSVGQALNRIRNGNSRETIVEIRNTPYQTVKDRLKRSLVGITFAGRFGGRRIANRMGSFSGYAVIDIDHITEPEVIKHTIFDAHDFVVACWVSPSGDGVKVLCQIDISENSEDYKAIYRALMQEFDIAEVDPATSSAGSLTFESYDPALLYRMPINTQVFMGRVGYTPLDIPEPMNTDINVPDEFVFKYIIGGLDYRGMRYVNGNRNSYLFSLACDANEFGIGIESCTNLINITFLPEADLNVASTIRSAYRKTERKTGNKRSKLMKFHTDPNTQGYGYQPE